MNIAEAHRAAYALMALVMLFLVVGYFNKKFIYVALIVLVIYIILKIVFKLLKK